ncbi:PREDICTED: putative HERV-K_Xq28 provirus ancestral Pol protein [Mesitornis unicolor]|uniref:putative HERV-K_Xq28 provirus ancestral Pol protein n=1 Tax=Mesitornis unicolor TaxID=54374 RepID=UPI0005294930|nr:PREDICTED: putative HERV-K_Xq28 provirus ancestral Pol protein [Mesitornis unicolor]
MIPRDWSTLILDLKDWFFTIPLDSQDAMHFAFSVPSINHAEPMQRYHWTVLPQGMKNSPTICQWYVAKALSPVRLKFPQILCYHYMDDMLFVGAPEVTLVEVEQCARQSLAEYGLEIAPEKVQNCPPWKYLV